MADNKYVLFADVMGFAALVESEPDFDLTPAMSRALDSDHNPNVKHPSPDDNAAPTPLVRTIGTFYRAVIGEKSYQRATSAVFFSDCAFLTFCTLDDAFFFAQGLINFLLLFKQLPLRVGIAYGTFIDARHTTLRTPLYSLTAAQFFGTGVTRAHSAERTKTSGFRAFIHPSIDIAASSNQFLKDHFVPLQPASPEAIGEVNLLTSGATFSDANLIGLSLTSMKAQAPPRSHHHYDATFVAIRNMYNAWPHRSYPSQFVRLIPERLINVPEPATDQ